MFQTKRINEEVKISIYFNEFWVWVAVIVGQLVRSFVRQCSLKSHIHVMNFLLCLIGNQIHYMVSSDLMVCYKKCLTIWNIRKDVGKTQIRFFSVYGEKYVKSLSYVNRLKNNKYFFARSLYFWSFWILQTIWLSWNNFCSHSFLWKWTFNFFNRPLPLILFTSCNLRHRQSFLCDKANQKNDLLLKNENWWNKAIRGILIAK